jgi:transposase
MLWSRGKSYPLELRERVFVHAEAGMTVGAIARTLVVSVSYVSKVLLRQARTGERAARVNRHPKRTPYRHAKGTPFVSACAGSP